jgi:hypothetical protein
MITFFCMHQLILYLVQQVYCWFRKAAAQFNSTAAYKYFNFTSTPLHKVMTYKCATQQCSINVKS